MRKYLLLFLMAFLCVGIAGAQDRGRNGKSKEEMFKEITEFKLKFLAQELELNNDQCKPFFDMYAQQTDERHRIWHNAMELERKVKDNPNASEADYTALSEAVSKAKNDEAALEARYDQIYLKVLSPKQVYQLKDAENKFREKMTEMRAKHPKRKHKK